MALSNYASEIYRALYENGEFITLSTDYVIFQRKLGPQDLLFKDT